MGLGTGSAFSASPTIAGSSAAVGSPLRCERCTNHAPLSVSSFSSAATSTPQLCAKPSSALLGLPWASRPALTAGAAPLLRLVGLLRRDRPDQHASRRGLHSARAAPLSNATPRFLEAGDHAVAERLRELRQRLGRQLLRTELDEQRLALFAHRAHAAACLEAREAEPLAPGVIRLGHGLGQRAHAQDVALALGHADRAARVQQVERVRGLAHLLVGRQRESVRDRASAPPPRTPRTSA
jgi:hypothetical protein